MKKAIVIYDSRYGNTEKLGKALSEGMKKGGLAADCVKAESVDPAKLVEYDVLAFGAPTEFLGISGGMKSLLKKLEGVDLKGKKGFAFDTALGGRLSGSAAKGLEKKLENLHLSLVMPRASAKVKTVQGKTVLAEGSEAEFERIGSEIAAKTA